MARDIQGQDLSIIITNAQGAPVMALSRGIESFSAKPVYAKIEANNLDGRRVSQTFQGYSGALTLNLQENTQALTFVDEYNRLLQSGQEFRVSLSQKVFDPQLQARRTWLYPKCVLEFDEGDYNKSSAVKLKITWETGEDRISL